MIFNNIEFHNIEQLEKRSEAMGLRMHRFPQHLERNIEAKIPATWIRGCEIRFCTESSIVNITLTASDNDGEIMVLFGDYYHSIHRLIAGTTKTITIERPKQFDLVRSDVLNVGRFSSNVWRIFACGGCGLNFCDISTTMGYDIRPPQPQELPAKRWLAYGSSITNGGITANNYNCYIQQTARLLGVDVLNMGLSGGCLCEKEMADYIVERDDWDFATLELGINMRERFTIDEFKSRAEYLINIISNKKIDKKIFVITIFPNCATFLNEENEISKTEKKFNRILEEIVMRNTNDNVSLINGYDVLNRFDLLSVDLVHPSEACHSVMGSNLANILKDLI